MIRSMMFLFFLLPQLSLAFEILDQGQSTVTIQIGNTTKALGEIEFEIVRTSAVGIYSCDNHPDDPICESSGRLYFESEAFDYLKTLEPGVQYRFFAPTEIPEVTWEEAKSAKMVSGVLVVFKADDLSPAALETAVQALAESYF